MSPARTPAENGSETLALFGHVYAAREGDVSLAADANVRAWLVRVAALPGFVPLPPA
ncbi:MAG TPA: hypothetical protein VFG69_08420 [Nannocystaceae bacterium]|nr:hypothetical protein [Nannocystaceae bacterium]